MRGFSDVIKDRDENITRFSELDQYNIKGPYIGEGVRGTDEGVQKAP